ncbi:GNAT family N-acetyltransferase [Agromyces seonyuensis]|uniref:GNAT family N-acetyltransferase n=1 Tax=Agromyces seonyuensis TaxID=2662446 RepID=A0A6I4NT30_9MICO|nr:GNAT family N-acetyltransferase [Agromyces seonyuensis]MWB97291.1 GNAT family N-acetyltransferase [Agromyces seonyuensis]
MPDAPVPAFTVRAAVPADAEAISDVRIASWRVAYAGMLSAAFLADLPDTAAIWRGAIERGHHVPVAELDGRVVGFAVARPCGDEHPVRDTELGLLYTLPETYGTGLGAALLDAALDGRPASLWVAERNVRAIAFYRKHGFEPDGERVIDPEIEDLAEIRMVR